MRSLFPGKDRQIRVGLVGKADLDFNLLMAQKVHASAAMLSPLPVMPEHRGRASAERMQQHADLAWLRGFAALPLALLAQLAGTATASLTDTFGTVRRMRPEASPSLPDMLEMERKHPLIRCSSEKQTLFKISSIVHFSASSLNIQEIESS